MLINFTNHPYQCWSDIQKKVAEENYGQVIDISFPVVDPQYNEEGIMKMAEKWAKEIIDLRPKAVLCQGEMGLCFAVVKILMKESVTVLHACSERIVRETMKEGKLIKVSEFVFRRFRKYVY